MKDLWALPEQEFLSPMVDTFMRLGGYNAFVGLQALLALGGLRSAKDTLATLAMAHAFQFVIGLWRTLAAMNAQKVSTLAQVMGAGGGPTLGAFVLSLGSLLAIL